MKGLFLPHQPEGWIDATVQDGRRISRIDSYLSVSLYESIVAHGYTRREAGVGHVKRYAYQHHRCLLSLSVSRLEEVRSTSGGSLDGQGGGQSRAQRLGEPA